MLFRKSHATFLFAVLALGTHPVAMAADAVDNNREAGAQASWHSQSLTMETVTGPNGAITTPTALSVNPRLGMTESKVAEPVAPGVYALRGWGIAHSFAIQAPNGWIIVDTGEPIQVAPMRTDTTDSVAFYFPERRLMVTNFLVIDTIYNIYTLRGGPYRDPEVLLNDARWAESKNAEILLDIHNVTLRGEAVVREALERSVDSTQLIHDQALRLVASGLGPREAAESIHMPRHLRESREGYGQVESHVRQVYNANVGWFDGDVYQINPLSLKEEAERMVQAIGGRAAVQEMAAQAATDGGFANWRWTLKLTSPLLRLDPADAVARQARATVARALGQRAWLLHHRGAGDGGPVAGAGAAADHGRTARLSRHAASRRPGGHPGRAEP